MFKDVNTDAWNQRDRSKKKGTEENLLYQYCCRFGGVTFTEVPLDTNVWGRKARRIDAVHFRRHKTKRRIVSYKSSDFKTQLKSAARNGEKVEVVEVKKILNRGVIGQVIIAKYLLTLERKGARPKMVVVCGEKVKEFNAFCKKYHIQVWSPHTTKV